MQLFYGYHATQTTMIKASFPGFLLRDELLIHSLIVSSRIKAWEWDYCNCKLLGGRASNNTVCIFVKNFGRLWLLLPTMYCNCSYSNSLCMFLHSGKDVHHSHWCSHYSQCQNSLLHMCMYSLPLHPTEQVNITIACVWAIHVCHYYRSSHCLEKGSQSSSVLKKEHFEFQPGLELGSPDY